MDEQVNRVVARVESDLDLGRDEIIIRLQGSDGLMRAYALDGYVMADRAKDIFPELMSLLPPGIKQLADGFIFGLRHGPLQKLLKSKHMEGEYDKSAKNKDAEALACIFKLLVRNIQEASEKQFGDRFEPIDLTSDEIGKAYQGTIRRVPAYDELPKHVEARDVQYNESLQGAEPADSYDTASAFRN